jgi:hypothetical protein
MLWSVGKLEKLGPPSVSATCGDEVKTRYNCEQQTRWLAHKHVTNPKIPSSVVSEVA